LVSIHAGGGEGRCLDQPTARKRSLHIDIIYPYIPHNYIPISEMLKGIKPHKNQISFLYKNLWRRHRIYVYYKHDKKLI
jgi:hypothetical protein